MAVKEIIGLWDGPHIPGSPVARPVATEQQDRSSSGIKSRAIACCWRAALSCLGDGCQRLCPRVAYPSLGRTRREARRLALCVVVRRLAACATTLRIRRCTRLPMWLTLLIAHMSRKSFDGSPCCSTIAVLRAQAIISGQACQSVCSDRVSSTAGRATASVRPVLRRHTWSPERSPAWRQL